MLNAPSKLAAAALAALLLVASCGKNNDDAQAADQLVAEASAALARGDFQLASDLLDSLSAAYPHEIEAGRAALKLRPAIMERKTAQEIAELQMYMAAAQAYTDSMQRFFTLTPRSDDQPEPFLIHKDVPANWRDRNTAVARLSPSGEFYMISSLAGNRTGHNAISLTGEGVTVSSGSVAVEPEPLLSRESLRFSAGKADTLGVFATQMDGKPLRLDFIGGKKAPSVNLSAKEVHAIADTWRLHQSLSTLAPSAQRLEQLKAKLQVSRDQQARQNQNDQ